jgi:enterochelin esterase-like enzyme
MPRPLTLVPAAVLLGAAACGGGGRADGGVDAGWDPAATAVLPARVAGWEDRLLTYQLTSSVPGIASRQVTVLTPPGYGDPVNADRRYPVLYMHDGQNCLDHDGFGHGGWQAHTISTAEVDAGRMAPIVLVFVDNTASRTAEYVPGLGSGQTTAEAYLDFLQLDVAPFVERHWRAAPAPAGRGLGGSSYGALISLYGAWTRPERWGLVMAMSTAYGYDFIGLAQQATSKRALRIYLDSGTLFYGGGDDGMAQTIQLRDLLESQGWVLGTDLQYVLGQGQNHSEDFWRLRLPGALDWLSPPP